MLDDDLPSMISICQGVHYDAGSLGGVPLVSLQEAFISSSAYSLASNFPWSMVIARI